jgi:hypothetical protein
VIDVGNPDASAPIATSTPTSTAPPLDTTRKPPPVDVGDDPRRNWHRNRPPCGGPKGPCPPYGCVFPDEACDIVVA